MAIIAEYFAQRNFDISRTPRASQNIVDTGKGIQAQTIGGAASVIASQADRVARDQLIIEASKQASRDNITLAGMKGALADFEFNSTPDPDSVKTIGDFPAQEQTFHKEWDRFQKRQAKGKSKAVTDAWKIHTENQKSRAKINWRNKSRPMERSWAIADLKEQWANRLKGNVGNPVQAQSELHELVDSYRPYLTSTEEQGFRSDIDKSVDAFQIQLAIDIDPEASFGLIDKAKEFDEAEKNALRSQARSAIARREREEKVRLQEAREDTMKTLLANVWDNKLKDPNVVTRLMEAGYLDVADAKHLRETMLNPDPPKTTNEAYIAMMYAKDGIAQGTETRESALKQAIEWSSQLSPTDGKAFIDDIFGEHDTMNAFWNRESQAYMEKQILEVATMSGILYGSGEQQAMSAKALLAFDTAKKEAAAKGDPLTGRDLLLKAHEVMLPFRDKPLIEGEDFPSTLRNLTPEQEIRQILGLPAKTAGQAAIDAFNKTISEARVEIWKDGKRYTVPAKDLDAALKKGYTRKKE